MSAAVQPAHWPETILPESHNEKGSLGSDVLALRGGSPRMLKAMTEVLATEFRKSWYDLTAGIAVFMAPSRVHEFTSRDAIELVKALCHAKAVAVVALGSATARTDDRDQGLEPDESFLIGERAARFLGIEARDGTKAALADLGEKPPDLAVEVEHTHYDPNKVAIYRALGVPELWEMATSVVQRAPRILDLQAEGSARSVSTSRILPGVRAERLPAAIAELKEIGGFAAFVEGNALGEPVIEHLLATARVSESAPRRSPSTGPGLR